MQDTKRFKDDASIASRYLADQLGDAERADFEALLLKDPEVLRELEATARLKAGLHCLRASGELDRLLKPKASVRWPVLASLAASLAVVVVGANLTRQATTPDSRLLEASLAALVDQSGRTLDVGATQALVRTRGGYLSGDYSTPYDAVIELPSRRAAIELHVMPETRDESSTYRVTLARHISDEGRPLATVTGLRTAENGFLTVFVDSTALALGSYDVIVDRDGGDGTDKTSFAVRLIPPATH